MSEAWSTLLSLFPPGTAYRLAETGLLLIGFVALRLALSRVGKRVLREPERRFHVVKYGRILLNLALALSLYQLWLNRGWSFASFLGLLSAGIAFVFREPLLNVAGWLFILARRPFELGHRVQVGDSHAGDVIDIGINDFTLLEIGNWVEADQSTGRIVHVPNSVVFTQGVANYSEGFPLLWNELQLLLTYESDWAEAKRLLQSIGEEQSEFDENSQEQIRQELAHFERYLISYTHLTPTVYVSKDPSGIMLTLRYLCKPRRRRATETRLWKAIFEQILSVDGIDPAYPTQRLIGLPERPSQTDTLTNPG